MTQHKEVKTAIAFVRVSSDEQAEGLSLESQEQKIAEWCRNRGYEIIGTIRAEGESAYTDEIKNRPQFIRLLDEVTRLRPSVVVVYSMDRWARSLVVSSASIQKLREQGVGFASVMEQLFDFSNPADSFQVNILAAVAQFQSALTAQHVKRVNDLKFEKGLHRGLIPFGYMTDPLNSRGSPLPPAPHPVEHPVMQELFRRMLSGRETYRTLANWLNRQGFVTRNTHRSDGEKHAREAAKPRPFTEGSIRSILHNPFYAGFVQREHRTRHGSVSGEPELREGLHEPAVSPEDFTRVQSIIRAHANAPRSASPKLRKYLGKGLIYCHSCTGKAWCKHPKAGLDYYQESSSDRGTACDAAGRYWPTSIIDYQIEQILRPLVLPADWKERALQLANAENNLLDLRTERQSLDRKRRNLIDLFKDAMIDRVEFDRDIGAIENRLQTLAPADVGYAEILIEDFDSFQAIWDGALLWSGQSCCKGWSIDFT